MKKNITLPHTQAKNLIPHRAAGILMAVFSLPSPYGIGDLGKGSHLFLDFLGTARQSYWQILPLGPTSSVFGNSPYMSFSAFGGNPLLISPDPLINQGILSRHDVPTLPEGEYSVNYKIVSKQKYHWLGLAWQRLRSTELASRLAAFKASHTWATELGLFLACRELYHSRPWYEWPTPVRHREPTTLATLKHDLADRIDEFCFHQLLFLDQWNTLRSKARKQQIAIIGDLPIYVGLDSVDVWANQEIFQLDPESCRPTHIAGVPPDYFSATGQLWGNPLYRWNTRHPDVRDHLYRWWEQRLSHLYSLVDIVRIDHFRGFAAYWSVPADKTTAVDGTWQKGPGRSFFRSMEKRLGKLPVIAEDLGVITPDVEHLRDSLGYPGMKVLLFGFDGNPDNPHLPHNIAANSVVYTGTHDNDTAVGWFLNPDISRAAKRRAKRYANRSDEDASTFHRDLLHIAFASRARLAVAPMQDVLGFGNDCRMNIPGTVSGNWQWRCAERFISPQLADWLGDMTHFFGRHHETDSDLPGKPQEKGEQ